MLLTALPASAAPELLVALHDEGSYSTNGPVALSFWVVSPDGQVAILDGAYSAADTGRVIVMPPADLAIAEAGLTSHTGQIGMTTVAQSGQLSAESWIWSDYPNVDARVPRLGPGLWGYDITSIEQTIDRVEFITNCGAQCYTTGFGEQTVRIYGQLAVPEPSVPAMLLCGVVLTVICRRAVSVPWPAPRSPRSRCVGTF
jgi:hypothetical protein